MTRFLVEAGFGSAVIFLVVLLVLGKLFELSRANYLGKRWARAKDAWKTPTYCEGCGQNRGAAWMAWTAEGLYRCNTCRHSDDLFTQTTTDHEKRSA